MTHLRSVAGGLLAAMAVLLSGPLARAQDARLDKFEPSDVYFQAWLILREADESQEAGEFLEAFNKYDKAKQLFDSVALYHPEFKPDLVQSRQKSTTESMESIKEKAILEQKKNSRRSSGLVEGPASAQPRRDFEIPQLSPAEQREIQALQRQIAQYRSELKKARSDRDANAIALRQLEAKRDRLARAPLTGQLRNLSERISKVERERDAMASALRDSRAEHQNILAQLATARADSVAAQQRAEDLQKMVEVQQAASKQAVEGLRRQLKELRLTLAEKDKKNADLEARNAQLLTQVQEARAEISDLKAERDALLVERDQMAALLKLNESGRVRLLIKQNMDLGRDLKIARDRLQELHNDNNVTKDQLIEAKRDLAQAKGRLIDFQRENASQKSRLEALQGRLQDAGSNLDENLKTAKLNGQSREEMEMLRGIIARQLRIQEHRKRAKEAVMAEIQRMGQVSGPFADKLGDLFEQDLKLTAEESQLIKEYKIDEDFIFSDRPSATEIEDAGQQLQQNIAIKDNLARRAYSNGRFLAAREVFESILAEHPGHVDTILNLGVVHVKNNEIPLAVSSFNDALLIRGDNLPFAHFMLGVCHYHLGDLKQSSDSLRRSLDFDADNARAYIFLGSVAGRERKAEEAETHFKAAIEIDPTLADPYYNLAVIYLQKGNKEEALKYYREALKRGADPNLEFEASLAQR